MKKKKGKKRKKRPRGLAAHAHMREREKRESFKSALLKVNGWPGINPPGRSPSTTKKKEKKNLRGREKTVLGPVHLPVRSFFNPPEEKGGNWN